MAGSPTYTPSEAEVRRRRWIVVATVAVAALSCAGLAAYVGDLIELIAHPGPRQYSTLKELKEDFVAVYLIQDRELAPTYRAAMWGNPKRIAVATRSGERVTMYVEQPDRSWLKHDAFLKQFAAGTRANTTTFRYELVNGVLTGSWHSNIT